MIGTITQGRGGDGGQVPEAGSGERTISPICAN